MNTNEIETTYVCGFCEGTLKTNENDDDLTKGLTFDCDRCGLQYCDSEVESKAKKRVNAFTLEVEGVGSAQLYEDQFELINGVHVFKTDKKETPKAQAPERDTAKVQVGDTFYTSWGYDQTNYNFLIVTGFTKSGKSAKCRMIRATRNDEKSGRGYDALVPTNHEYGDEFTMKITDHRGEKNLRGSYPYGHEGSMKWGKRLDSFWPTEKNKSYDATAFGYGH